MTERVTVPLTPGSPAPIAGAAVGSGLVFVSGLAPIDMATMTLAGDDITSQAEAVLDQLADVLARAGSDLGSVLRVECFLADASDFAGWNEAFAGRFGADPPARTTLVTGFVMPGMRIEVQATALAHPPSG